eukprot:6212744-Pleurochrysis_carterae.AAC.7
MREATLAPLVKSPMPRTLSRTRSQHALALWSQPRSDPALEKTVERASFRVSRASSSGKMSSRH